MVIELLEVAQTVAEAAGKRADAALRYTFRQTPRVELALTLGLGPRIDRALGAAPNPDQAARLEEIRLGWLRRANNGVVIMTLIVALIVIPDMATSGPEFRSVVGTRCAQVIFLLILLTYAAHRYPLAMRFHYAALDPIFFLSGRASNFVLKANWDMSSFYYSVMWHRILVTCLIRDSFAASLSNFAIISYCACRDAELSLDDIVEMGISKVTSRFSVVLLLILLIYATLRAKLLLCEVSAVEASKVNHLRTVFHFVSHEYRNHFFAGSLALDSLTSNHTMTLEARQDVKILERAHKNISSLMENILHLSRMEGDRSAAWRGQSRPFSVSRDLALQLRSFAATTIASDREQGSVNFQLIEDPSVQAIPLVNGSLSLLAQALNNLVSNAIKFTPSNGDVRVLMSAEANLNKRKAKLLIVVSDTGSGIDADALVDIFKPFKRSRTGDALDRGGSGLGLSFAKRIIESYEGGTIKVTSRVGEGSIFESIKLVAVQRDGALGAGRVWVRGITRAEETPDRAVANYICRQAAKVGVTLNIIEASDGESAVDLVRHGNGNDGATFDAITMDQYMPGTCDGLEATRRIRALGFEGPIIGVTGEEDLEQVQNMREAGCNAIWQKGGDLSNLLVYLGLDVGSVKATNGNAGPPSRARPQRSQSNEKMAISAAVAYFPDLHVAAGFCANTDSGLSSVP
ncbi:Hybrid signal transduction histidine kinase A [Hondaea fermentalgiana]|uniref:histidine kinase n=1 Tax=Hondaea fermentalgiana TaxID=2315210 RepID=A0A2R5GBS0_9STRA|nr:Hybrid signal transduction histidine kinase A [Hondaea fermentalgiana]|eukprot:GBG28035.1 Hybrid signal transduction histidine kinase A [Hondaea fermentalgiana]